MIITPSCCPHCSSSEFSTQIEYFTPDQYEIAVGIRNIQYYRAWVSCLNCGLSYSRFSRDPDILHSIYDSSYRSEDSNWRDTSSEQRFITISSLPYDSSETKQRILWITNNIDFAKLSSRLHLDIGGGSGVFSYELSRSGWVSSVLDPDLNNKFLSKYNITLITDYLDDSFTFSRKYDLVTLIFVLEHSANIHSFLSNTLRGLKNNGYLYVEVPSASSFELRDPDDDVFNSCHLSLFTVESLKLILEFHSLQVTMIETYTTMRGYISLRALCRFIVN